MRILFALLCFFALAYADLVSVEVDEKADNLFDIGNGVIVQTEGCGRYRDCLRNSYKGFYDSEGHQLILDRCTCEVINIFTTNKANQANQNSQESEENQ